MKRRLSIRTTWPLGFALIVCLAAAPMAMAGTRDLSIYDFQQGDILLQHVPSYLCSVVADVTSSWYSHCGLIVYRQGKPYVLEAIGTVRYTPIRDWLGRGVFGWFTQIRVKGLAKGHLAKVVAEAEKMLGRPYDIQYELDDRKIYCSELVYKAFRRGARIETGKRQRLRDLKWRPHEKFIRHLAGGVLPLAREMVTPQSLKDSPNTELVYSSFPPRADAPKYELAVLQGTWRGEYTIKGLDKAIATIAIGTKGRFLRGSLKMVDGSVAKMDRFTLSPMTETGAFTARLHDSRGIETVARAQVLDRGHRVVGTWTDDQGYRGVFSLGKTE